MQTKGETSHPLTPISRSRTCIHELCKNCLHPMEQEWQGQFSATNKGGDQNPNTHKRRFFKSDDRNDDDAKVHALLFTKSICKRRSVRDRPQ